MVALLSLSRILIRSHVAVCESSNQKRLILKTILTIETTSKSACVVSFSFLRDGEGQAILLLRSIINTFFAIMFLSQQPLIEKSQISLYRLPNNCLA